VLCRRVARACYLGGVDLAQVFAYLKPLDQRDSGSVLNLTDDGGLLARPFIGRLVTTLVHDDGHAFTFLQRRHLREFALGEDDIFATGLGNLERLVADGRVRLHRHGAAYAVIAGGNFEASLLMCQTVWQWVSTHIGAQALCAVAPARDVLMVGDAAVPDVRAELGALLCRVADAELDHALTVDTYHWDGLAWSCITERN